MCDFISGRKSNRSRLDVQYFDKFRTRFWERLEDEFDRVRSINLLTEDEVEEVEILCLYRLPEKLNAN
jgi:hypothetical protein